MGIHKKYNKFFEAYYKRPVKKKKQVLSNEQLEWIKSTGREKSRLLSLRVDFSKYVWQMGSFYNVTFSDLCKTDESKLDIESEYIEMQRIMDKAGFDRESIKNLYSKEADKICGFNLIDQVYRRNLDGETHGFPDKIEEYKIHQQNGNVDLYLYKTADYIGLNKDDIELGGEGWSSSWEIEEELKIWYKYGYHHTAYGHMLLNQVGATPKQFTDKVKSYLIEMLREDWSDEVISNIIRSKPNDRELSETLRQAYNWHEGPRDIDGYIIIEADRVIIQIKDIVDDLNKLFKEHENDGGGYSVEYDSYKITFEDFTSQISKLLYDFADDITLTNEELIIWMEVDTTKYPYSV